MKLLKKVRIINWHYFYNVTFDLDQINFLTGQNAAGKSTLIDAMQIVLLGDTSGRTFNKAANEKSGRTLKGYLKGEIGDDGLGSFKYLRSGRFSSYIVLEWYDDLNDKYFLTGIVFDVYEDNSEEHHFFILNDKIPENDFVSLGVPMSYKSLLEYFQQNYTQKEFFFADSNAQYQEKIKELFGNLKDKYFSLFKKAVSFTPITNIEQFLTEYVCDVPSEINIDSMRSNIQQYKRLELESENMQIKIKRLEEIHNQYLDFYSKKKDLNLASYISKRITYQVFLDQISTLQKDISSNNNRLEEIEQQLVDIDKEISTLTKQKESYIGEKVSSGSYNLTLELTNARDNLQRKIDGVSSSLNTIRNNFSSYINNFSNVANQILAFVKSPNRSLKILDKYQDELDKLDSVSNDIVSKASEFKSVIYSENQISSDSLLEFRDSITLFKEVVNEVYISLKNYYAELSTSHTLKKQQISDMQQGSKMYDYSLKQIRSELEHKLSDYYNEKVQVLIYADLVDVKTPRWIKAIEGFIYRQKLNLFVEDKYYETANKLLSDILRSHNYYNTGLVDSRKLHERNFECLDHSLAEEIITDHQGARDYSNFLLGKMIKCETFKEARESGQGITPSCEGYRNFASFVIPEKNYQYPLLGRRVSQEMISLRNGEFQNEEKEIIILKTFIDCLSFASKLETLNTNEVDSALVVLEDASNLSGLKSTLSEYQNELDNAGSYEITNIDNKIKRIEQDIIKLQDDKQSLILEKGTISQAIKIIQEEKIPYQIENSNKILKEINETFDKDFINDYALVKFQEEVSSGKSLIAIRSEYDDLYTRTQNKIRSSMNLLQEYRREYVLTYKLSYDISKDTNEDFDRDLELIRDVKLPEYQAQIKDAYDKATKEFKDDFIFKLKTSIETVRSQIDELNEALKDAKFGQDSYQFVVSPSPEYREYYDMITDELLLTYGEDEQLYLDKYQDVMSNLFKLIGDVSGSNKDKDSVIEQNVEKFTDYRTYLMFDMMVTKGDDRTYSLAKNMKKQSGGETQTPFYVSILASFSQLYRIRSNSMNNSIRLVIFDEAFSKMDSVRIIESIKILRSLGLQVVLSAPSEKVSDLSKIVDKTLLVSRQNNRSFVDTFEIKK